MKLLLVEDEVDLASVVRDYLTHAGFQVSAVHTADEAMSAINGNAWDMMIVDIMLPSHSGQLDGFSLCKYLREKSSTPIIITSARIEEWDRLKGFDLGADDYLCKPYSPRELVARVKAIFKRLPTPAAIAEKLQLHPDALSVTFLNKTIELTQIEFRLLQILYQHPNAILSRQKLMTNAYDDHRIVSDRTMDSHITKLRKKLSQLTDMEVIHSVYGAGYKFEMSA